MHILYLHQYFITPQQVGGTRSYEFARRFVNAGHQVTMLTAQDRSFPWTGKNPFRKREIMGIQVIEIKAGYADSRYGTTLSYWKRMFNFLHFALISSCALFSLSMPDVIFATSTPLTIGIPALFARKRWRVPFVFEVRDLWPEAPIQMAALKNPVNIALARWLERTIYRHAEHIVALSPGMAEGVQQAGVAAQKVSVIPNASDIELFHPDVDGAAVRDRLRLHGRFVCTYFGAMGEANDLTYVLQAARILQTKQEQQIVFVLHGHGKRRAELQAFCQQHHLMNVVFSDSVPEKDYIAQLAAASDVCMTIYKNVPVLYTCSPNKFFDALAAGRPVLVNTPGWLQELVNTYEVGVFVQPENAESLVEQVTYLRDHPELCARYGKNARRLAETQFSRDQLAAQLLEILHHIAIKQERQA
ncbi:glycosyl transferase group 1 [Candidatus Vecturithrix granuli]|uniref:Glycosyl transferase group 1 n=1 Tax=Vecturithrix granuli TaxID=1499967 RepID=A0A081BXT9_VECG1|nr:glycosyl transferase group 1 [Candidatus Vecturithrix granuli]